MEPVREVGGTVQRKHDSDSQGGARKRVAWVVPLEPDHRDDHR